MTLSQEYFLLRSQKYRMNEVPETNSGRVRGTGMTVRISKRVRSDRITHPSCSDWQRMLPKRSQKVSRPDSKIMSQHVWKEVISLDFGRIFTPIVFQWFIPLVSSGKYPLGRIALTFRMSCGRKSVDFLDFSDLLTLYVSFALTLRE